MLTPPGTGAIAVIRLQGPDALKLIRHFVHHRQTDLPIELDPHNDRTLRYGQFCVDREVVDDVLVCARPDEEHCCVAEINAHGGLRVVERILAALQGQGAKVLTESGPACSAWPARSVIEAEALACLSKAQTRRAVRFLIRQYHELRPFLEELANLAADDAEAARRRLSDLAAKSKAGLILANGATVALVGPPNAGKSTLTNRLFGNTLSLECDEPGTTRDWVAEPMSLLGIPITLVDTPGIRVEGDLLEQAAIKRSLPWWGVADLRLVVLDKSAPFPDDFINACSASMGDQSLIIGNKADLESAWQDGRLPDTWGEYVVQVSAKEGAGLVELEQRIAGKFSLPSGAEDCPLFFTEQKIMQAAALANESERDWNDLPRRIHSTLIGID